MEGFQGSRCVVQSMAGQLSTHVRNTCVSLETVPFRWTSPICCLTPTSPISAPQQLGCVGAFTGLDLDVCYSAAQPHERLSNFISGSGFFHWGWGHSCVRRYTREQFAIYNAVRQDLDPRKSSVCPLGICRLPVRV